MKVELIAKIGVCLSFADGDIDPNETAALMMALTDLGMSDDEADVAIEAAIDEIQSAKNVDDILAEAVKAVSPKHRPKLFELCAHVLMADGAFTEAEAQRMAAMRTLMGVDEAVAFKVVASAAADAAMQHEGLSVE